MAHGEPILFIPCALVLYFLALGILCRCRHFNFAFLAVRPTKGDGKSRIKTAREMGIPRPSGAQARGRGVLLREKDALCLGAAFEYRGEGALGSSPRALQSVP